MNDQFSTRVLAVANGFLFKPRGRGMQLVVGAYLFCVGTAGLGPVTEALAADEGADDDNVSLEELRRQAREKKKETSSPGAGDANPEAPSRKGKGRAGKRKAAMAPQDNEPEELDIPDVIPEPLHCPNPSEAPPGAPAFLRCVLRPDIRADKVVYFYRLPGKEEFERVEATRTKKGWFTTTVPKEAFTGKLVQYYVEAQSKNGQTVVSNGRWDSPNALLVKEGAPILDEGSYVGIGESAVTESREGEDDPLARRSHLDKSDSDYHYYVPERRFWAALGLGSGWGGHGKADLEWYEVTNGSRDPVSVAGGTRSAGRVLLLPEFGFRMNNVFSVALAVRAQILVHSGDESKAPLPMAGSPAPAAFSVLAKGIYTRTLSDRLALHLWGGLGGGEGVRFLIPEDPDNSSRARRSSDTVRVGPMLVGAGAAIDYAINDEWGVRANLPQLLLAMPELGWVFDFTVGAIYAF